MDPLSDVISLIRPKAAIAKPISGRGDWGVRYRAHDAPGFTLVLDGEAWLTFDHAAPRRLARGDFLLVATTPAFSLASAPGMPCRPAEPSDRPVRHGEPEGEPDFIAMGGSFSFEKANGALLASLLPDLVHIPAALGRASRFGRVIDLLFEESRGDAPGKALVTSRMLDILLVEALRWHSEQDGAAPPGLLTGLQDPGLARALLALHGDVRAPWTVAALASLAGMSRSAFAARFAARLGCAPIEYLARWRMGLAKDALLQGRQTLEQIAEDIGYESASAFSTAFRKRLGIPPGRFARLQGEMPASV